MGSVRQHFPQTGENKQFAISKVFFVVGVLMAVAALTFEVAASGAKAASGINRSINYQGRLMDTAGSAVADGTYQIVFRIYNQATGGTHLWSASTTNGLPTGTAAAIPIQVKSGLFSILLGDIGNGQVALPEDLFNNDNLYLGVKIAADSEMTPRKRLSSVPYAFNSETLQGQYASHTVANTGGDLFGLRQASADAANATRTTLYVETKGTSNIYDFLMRLSNGTADVFNVTRQGNVMVGGTLLTIGQTTLANASATSLTLSNDIWVSGTASTSRLLFINATGTNFAVMGFVNSDFLPRRDNRYFLGLATNRWKGIYAVSVTSTNIFTNNITATTVSTTNLTVNGQAVTTSVPTWQQVTDKGKITFHDIQFAGGTSTGAFRISDNLIVTGTSNMDKALFINATGTNIALIGYVNSDWSPMVNNTYSLGSSSNRWKNVFASAGVYSSGTVMSSALFVYGSATTTNLYATGFVSTTAIYINGRSVTTSVPTLNQVALKGNVSNRDIQFAGGTSTKNFYVTGGSRFMVGTGSPTGNNLFQLNSGTTAPSASFSSSIFELDSEDGNKSDYQFRLSSDQVGSYAALLLSRSRGTLAAPTIVVDGDTIGGIHGVGYLGAGGWQLATGITFTVDGTPSVTSLPSAVHISTTPNGSTSPLERLTIKSNGSVGINNANPTARLEVNGDVTIDSATSRTRIGWTTSNIPSAGIESVRSLATYNGYLYAGQGDSAGDGDIYVCNPATAGSATDCDNAADWTRVLDNAGTTRVNTMVEYNGYFYDGEGNGAGLGVVRYCSAMTGGICTGWTAANLPAGPQQVRQLIVYNGYLYAANDTGVSGSASVAVCKPRGGGNAAICDVAADWVNIAMPVAGYETLSAMAVFKNRLYAFVGNTAATDNDIFVCNPAAAGSSERCDNAADWTRVLNQATYDTYSSAAVYNDFLYLGTGQAAAGQGDVQRCDPTRGGDTTLCDNTADLTIPINNAGTFTNTPAMSVFDGSLFIGFEGAVNDGDIVEYKTSYASSSDPGTGFQATYAFATYNGKLYAGRGNATGNGQVWFYGKPGTASYNLRFMAGSSTGDMWFSNESYNYQGVGTPNAYKNGVFKFSSGIITEAGAYDLAEQYPTQDSSLRSGDVVSLDESHPGFIRKSFGANDKNVLGVVSTKAGFTLSGPKDGDTRPVALVGRVPVKISGENGDVAVGDPLTSASLSGFAMKATQPGMIIGHALESFASSTWDVGRGTRDVATGTIIMVVQTGYYFGDDSTPVGQLAAYLGQSTSTQIIQQAFQGDAYAIEQVAGGIANPQVAEGSSLSDVQAASIGTLIVRTAALVAGDLTVGGTTRLMGHVVLSDDTAGIVDLKPGEQYVEVKFTKPFDTVPVVVVTPESDAQEFFQPWMGKFRVGNKTINGFRIYVNEGACYDPTNCGRTMKFNWLAVGLQKGQASISIPASAASIQMPPDDVSASTTTINNEPALSSGGSGTPDATSIPAPTVTTVDAFLDDSTVIPTSAEPLNVVETIPETEQPNQTNIIMITEGGGTE